MSIVQPTPQQNFSTDRVGLPKNAPIFSHTLRYALNHNGGDLSVDQFPALFADFPTVGFAELQKHLRGRPETQETVFNSLIRCCAEANRTLVSESVFWRKFLDDIRENPDIQETFSSLPIFSQEKKPTVNIRKLAKWSLQQRDIEERFRTLARDLGETDVTPIIVGYSGFQLLPSLLITDFPRDFIVIMPEKVDRLRLNSTLTTRQKLGSMAFVRFQRDGESWSVQPHSGESFEPGRYQLFDDNMVTATTFLDLNTYFRRHHQDGVLLDSCAFAYTNQGESWGYVKHFSYQELLQRRLDRIKGMPVRAPAEVPSDLSNVEITNGEAHTHHQETPLERAVRLLHFGFKKG